MFFGVRKNFKIKNSIIKQKAEEASMNQSLKAAVYGLAVADALGVPYEFLTRGSFKAVEMVGYGSQQ